MLIGCRYTLRDRVTAQPIRCDSKKGLPTTIPSVVDRTKTKELCVTKDRVPLWGSAERLTPTLCLWALRALTCPSWCIRTPPCCPPPHAGEAKLRPACPANAVIILLENTCPIVRQEPVSIMTSLPSENETYLVSPACGGDVEAVRPRQRGHENREGPWPDKTPIVPHGTTGALLWGVRGGRRRGRA